MLLPGSREILLQLHGFPLHWKSGEERNVEQSREKHAESEQQRHAIRRDPCFALSSYFDQRIKQAHQDSADDAEQDSPKRTMSLLPRRTGSGPRVSLKCTFRGFLLRIHV